MRGLTSNECEFLSLDKEHGAQMTGPALRGKLPFHALPRPIAGPGSAALRSGAEARSLAQESNHPSR